MNKNRCQAITQKGTRCTKSAVENGCCYIPAHKKQLLTDGQYYSL